jgi:hypothetical protein
VIVDDAQGGYQVSGLAYLRVESLANVNFDLSGEALACYNNLYSISLAARMFATANQDQLPRSLGSITNYLGWPLILYCPSDTNHTAPDTWEHADFANVSYVLDRNVPAAPTTNVLASCRAHHYWVQSDGTVRFGEIPPLIFSDPLNQVTFAGRPVSLKIGALGDLLGCQWFQNDAAMRGETNDVLMLPGLAVTNTARYYAIVTNTWGSATSHVAVVTANPIPRPRLTCAITNPPTRLNYQLMGPIGVECRLEVSPDLKSWTALGASVLTNGIFNFSLGADDPTMSHFYRATLR